MDDALRHELSAAKNSEDKAAIIAEVLFHTFSEERATLARQCSLLHWFDEAIFTALARQTSLSKSETIDFYGQFKYLPMVESLPWGLAFNKLTREGLLRRYIKWQPDLLKTAARLAAPAYKARKQDRRALSEAFFCSIVAGDTTSALDLLTELLERAASRGDWEYIARLLRMQGEAERLPFVQSLPLPTEYQVIRPFADSFLTQAFAAEPIPNLAAGSLAIPEPVMPSIEQRAEPVLSKVASSAPPSDGYETIPGTPASNGGRRIQVSRRLTRRQTLILFAGVGTAAGVGIVYTGVTVLPRLFQHSSTPTPVITTTPGPTATQHPTTPTPTPRPTPPPLTKAFYISRHHTNEVDTVAWSPTDNLIASGSRDKTVDVWKPATDNIFTYHGHNDWVFGMAWSPDGTLIASASADLTVQVWNPTTGVTSNLYSGHSGAVHGVVWSPDGKLIASASDDRTVQVWDANGATPLVTYRDHSAGVDAVAWSPDGTRIASASKDKTVQVWNATTGERMFTYPGHTAEVDSVMWSPDGTRIASGSYDKTAQIWDATTEKRMLLYTRHTDIVRWVAWSPDGKLIASASADQTAQVWDAITGQKSFTYHGHSNWVHCVAWSPDGTHIASSSADKTVQVWGVVLSH